MVERQYGTYQLQKYIMINYIDFFFLKFSFIIFDIHLFLELFPLLRFWHYFQ